MKEETPTKVISNELLSAIQSTTSESVEWLTVCEVCGAIYVNGSGSTRCCGSTQGLIWDVHDPQNLQAKLDSTIDENIRLRKTITTFMNNFVESDGSSLMEDDMDKALAEHNMRLRTEWIDGHFYLVNSI